MSLPKKNYSHRGQVLLSVLIALAVFAILSHALFTLIASSFDLVNFNKARITARHLAQEKIETVRNLGYSDVGTVGGIPPGIFNQEENIVRNGLNYLIKTSIIYIDDSFNGIGPPDDTDYKRVRIEVSWQGLAASRKNPIVLLSDINPLSSESSSGGTLTVLVFNANGEAVPQAEVTIIALSLDPAVNTTETTDDDGKITLPGADPCIECYEITATKEGYSPDRTYSAAEVTNPVKPHATIIAGNPTQVSFAIDLVGTMNITSLDSRSNNFAALGNVPFRLRGNKIIGTNALGQFVYKYDNNFTTDASGNINLSNIEWDTYQVLMPDPTSWDISGSIPLQPLSLIPAGNIDFSFVNETHSDHAILIIVKDPSQNLIASASARLYDGVSFDETKTTGATSSPDFGQAFFSNLEEKTHQIEATASGYLDFNGNFDVSGYTVGEVVLNPE